MRDSGPDSSSNEPVGGDGGAAGASGRAGAEAESGSGGGSTGTAGNAGAGRGGSAATSGASAGGAGTGGASGSPATLCEPESTRDCYTGATSTRDVGICHGGTQTCATDGSGYGACSGEVLPAAAEDCATSQDDNCDGVTLDTSEGCVCMAGSMEACYDGPAGTQAVGRCRAGNRTCASDGKSYGVCQQQILPAAESCATADDDNCNGQVNEGCSCSPGETSACYSGPGGTLGVGACRAGTQTCNQAGTGYGPCTGEVVATAETCNTPTDDNCNGQVNEGGAGCVCAPNSTAGCYTGPAGTQSVGRCIAGTQTCDAQGTAYGACTGQVVPITENCGTPADDNCNGQANEGCQTPATFAANVQPILQAHCAPCHTVDGNGGGNFATQFSATQLASYFCGGQTKGGCALVRIQNGSMPQGAGCTGNPTTDSGNPACLDAAEQAVIQAWVVGGQLP